MLCACGCEKELIITKRNKNKPPNYLKGHSNKNRERERIDPEKKFWERVEKTDSCWEWNGFITPNGYGQMKVNGKNMYVHRFSFQLHFGLIETNKLICHKCDNRKCVNPSHLFVGTHKDNTKDMDFKGRRVIKPGTQKITKEDAENIRILVSKGFHVNFVADKYNLKPCTIRNIVAKRMWKD